MSATPSPPSAALRTRVHARASTASVGAAIAFAALVLLAAAPLVISHRLSVLRRELAGAPERALALVREVETATLIEAAERRAATYSPEARISARYAQALGTEMERDSELAGPAPLPAHVRDALAALRRSTARWQETRAVTGASADSVVTARLPDVLQAVADADSLLARELAVGRTRMAALEHWESHLPASLVPIVLVAVGAVTWTARRTTALAREAEHARAALATASESRIALLRGLTHDLKNSLWAASGYASILRQDMFGPLADPQREKLARIEHLIEGAMRMVSHTLEIARADAGVLAVKRRPTDLHAVLEAAAHDYRAVAEQAGLALELELTERLPAVETDTTRVGTIIGNLLSNAIKYTPRGGRVAVRAACVQHAAGVRRGTWTVVQVVDSGPGIPLAHHERIFEEFVRLPHARAAASGAGVGLAMSRRVARLLGGDLLVASAEGDGATFSLWLPVGPAADAPPAEEQPAAPALALLGANAGRRVSSPVS